MSTIDVGSLIRLKRIEKGMKQKELADALHVSATAVNKWEKGKNYPDPQNLQVISQLLEIPITELLGVHPASSTQGSGANHAVSKPDSPPFSDEEDTSSSDETSFPEKPAPVPALSPPEISLPQTEDTAKPSDIAVVDIGDTDFIELPENSLPQPEKASDCPLPKRRRIRLKTAIPLSAFLLAGIIAVFWIAGGVKSNAPSFTVCDSYYGEYEGEYVYYVIAEYESTPTKDDLFNHMNIIREEYGDHFSDVNSFIVIYVQDYTEYIEHGFNDNTDSIGTLYPYDTD